MMKQKLYNRPTVKMFFKKIGTAYDEARIEGIIQYRAQPCKFSFQHDESTFCNSNLEMGYVRYNFVGRGA